MPTPIEFTEEERLAVAYAVGKVYSRKLMKLQLASQNHHSLITSELEMFHVILKKLRAARA